MKKFLLTLLIANCSLLLVHGQAARTTPSQFIFNALPINPAYAGSQFVSSLDMSYFGNGEEFAFLYRSVDGSLHGPMDFEGRKNLGLQFSFVHEGDVDEIQFQPSFAYRIDTDLGKIAFGVNLGFNFFSVDNAVSTILYEPFFTIDGGLGIYFHNDKLFAGISTLNIFEKLLKDERKIAGLFLKRENPYYLYTGFMQQLTDRFSLRPNLLLKFADGYELADDIQESISQEFAYDISASLIIEQNYWVTLFFGSSYYEEIDSFANPNTLQINRFGLSLHFLVGQLRLKYGIHRSTNPELGTEYPVSHLFGIGYDFGVDTNNFYRYF
ncbi:MAG: type IX secretion system PorP/SprF family membrane protein [Paraglaciecola sp.]|jgi:type IX secretion system PorP/SprF family membrane protein